MPTGAARNRSLVQSHDRAQSALPEEEGIQHISNEKKSTRTSMHMHQRQNYKLTQRTTM